MSKAQYEQLNIVHHLLNNSPSKYMFSFPKTPRFFKLKQDNGVDKFYNLPSTLTKRSTAMGFGKKSNFTSNNSNTEFVSIKRYFDKNYQPGSKYSFGVSRDKFSKVYYPGLKLSDTSIPGPGKYNIRKGPGLNSPKFTIRAKCGKNINTRPLSPGPGQYSPVINFNSEGKYPLSKISNVHTINFGNNRTRRFFYKINNVPGPGSYKLKGLFGINFISKYNSGKLISFPRKYETKKILDSTPGPGSYKSFSEFGNPSIEIRHENNKNNKIKKIKKKILIADGSNIKGLDVKVNKNWFFI